MAADDTGTGNLSKNPDAVPPGTPDAGENICRRCAGSGKVDGEDCPECDGTGKVLTPVGGAG
jgi:DnaJ-class molecular chaperone